jgi:nitrate reductase gamma subunit
MDELLNFLKGPMFRFSFAIMMLGLMRLFILSLMNGFDAKNTAKDKIIPKSFVRKMTFGFVFPIRAFKVKPFYASISIVFHAGLLITPIFLFDHSLLFENSVGFSLIALSLSKHLADWLAILTVLTGILLLILRIANKNSRFLSRKQDFLWPVLLLIPFITGILCAQVSLNPLVYDYFMLFHLISAILIFLLIPFTKIAHCILLPLSQWISARAWKFPPEAGENVTITLGKQGEKI